MLGGAEFRRNKLIFMSDTVFNYSVSDRQYKRISSFRFLSEKLEYIGIISTGETAISGNRNNTSDSCFGRRKI